MRRTDALALIPARGGSKGLPGKNLMNVGGLPLVGRCITAAKESERIIRVVVSTDDREIAEVARKFGADVVLRPAEISGDLASSESALLHALDLLSAECELPGNIAFLQCSSPFTTGSQVDRVLSALDDDHFNSSFSVKPWHGFLWLANGSGINHDPNRFRQRRQDLEPSYLETGAIYAMRTSAFRSTLTRFGRPWKPVIRVDSGPEIDTIADLALCQLLFDATQT